MTPPWDVIEESSALVARLALETRLSAFSGDISLTRQSATIRQSSLDLDSRRWR